MMRDGRRGVSLDDLLAADSASLTAHFVPPHEQFVSDVALVTEVEQILSVGPDAVVLLGQDFALGGWVVSVALRYAWERHAVALIVSDQLLSDSVVELARRFGVSLFTTARAIDRTAIALARSLGAREAGVLARLNVLHERVLRAGSLTETLQVVSHELGGGEVGVVIDGVVAQSVGRRRADAVDVRQRLVTTDAARELVAGVPRQEQEFTERALARAAASVHAFLLADELRELRRAAPLLSFAALVGLDDAPTPPDLGAGGPRAAVALRLVDGGADVATALAPVVGTRWHARFPRVPLARTDVGWVAVVPLRAGAAAAAELRARLSALELGALGIAIGLAAVTDDETEGTDGSDAKAEPGARADLSTEVLLRRARLAARVAPDTGTPLPFEKLTTALLRRLLAPAEAAEVARAAMPALFAEQNTEELIATVVTYLDCASSVSGAAERLGIHRNTLQLRLRRASELGVPLGDPERLLGIHLLFSVLERARAHPEY